MLPYNSNPHYRDDVYLDKIIREKYSASFMNDTKWVKLIDTLDAL